MIATLVFLAVGMLPSANIERLKLPDGWLDVEWARPGSFRYLRTWGAAAPASRAPMNKEDVKHTRTERGTVLEIASDELTLEIDRTNARLRVRETSGAVLFVDAAPPRREGNAIVVERDAPRSQIYYGLGLRGDESPDARGQAITPSKPFFYSSAGYATLFAPHCVYRFDMAKTDPTRVVIRGDGAEAVEFYVFHGPGIKEMLEENMNTLGPVSAVDVIQTQVIRGGFPLPKDAVTLPASLDLCGQVRALVHAGLSAILLPVFDMAPFRGAEDSVFLRAAQLAAIAPLAYDSGREPLPENRRKRLEAYEQFRKRLIYYFLTYSYEARDRGFPMIHPLAMQYPRDPAAALYTDEFMIGDELLATPLCTAANKRSAYLPMGIWTDFHTNQVHQGRRTIEIQASPYLMPLFAKNGSIVPLAPANPGEPTVAHYFPKLGGEFFILEAEKGDWTQLHAGPAGDYIRLETESKVTREYEWIVHHQPEPKLVEQGTKVFDRADTLDEMKAGLWFYDTVSRNLHVRIAAPEGSDIIVNISFPSAVQ